MDQFPVEDVEASIANRRLQRRYSLHDLEPLQRAEYDRIRDEKIADGASEATAWIYFRSPAWTWEQLCGREGWLLWDPATKAQHAFLLTVLS